MIDIITNVVGILGRVSLGIYILACLFALIAVICCSVNEYIYARKVRKAQKKAGTANDRKS